MWHLFSKLLCNSSMEITGNDKVILALKPDRLRLMMTLFVNCLQVPKFSPLQAQTMPYFFKHSFQCSHSCSVGRCWDVHTVIFWKAVVQMFMTYLCIEFWIWTQPFPAGYYLGSDRSFWHLFSTFLCLGKRLLERQSYGWQIISR